MMCPKCGLPVTGGPMGYEYRSEASLFGLPLVHIASGFNPVTKKPRIAIGGGAIGYYTLGGGAFGVHALGGNSQDPEAIEFFKSFLGSWVEQFQQSSGR